MLAADSSATLSAAKTSTFSEELAVVGGRLTVLEARLAQQAPSLHRAQDTTLDLERRVAQQEIASAGSLEDLRRAMSEHAERQHHALERMQASQDQRLKAYQGLLEETITTKLAASEQVFSRQLSEATSGWQQQLAEAMAQRSAQHGDLQALLQQVDGDVQRLRDSARDKLKSLEMGLLEQGKTSETLATVLELKTNDLKDRIERVSQQQQERKGHADAPVCALTTDAAGPQDGGSGLTQAVW